MVFIVIFIDCFVLGISLFIKFFRLPLQTDLYFIEIILVFQLIQLRLYFNWFSSPIFFLKGQEGKVGG
jgi:hypothetical protein